MPNKSHIQQFRDNLFLISLPVPIDGFDGFIGAWVHAGDPLVLVDVGPTVSIPHLLAAFAELGFGQPDLILLTHIHIDHAGGIGGVAKAFPKARVVCHPKGVSHLIDPERLWQGSLKTLGDIAKAYEPMAPAPGEQIVASNEFNHPQIRVIETPGHAAHHVSYLMGDTLFAGEVGGVCLPTKDDSVYLRPATPPRFFLETSLNSIDRVLADTPEQICYGHIGFRTNAVHLLNAHRDQLQRWHEMIQPFFDSAKGQWEIAVMQKCRDYLLANDPLLAGFSQLPDDVREREKEFMKNSILGYWGYLETVCDNTQTVKG